MDVDLDVALSVAVSVAAAGARAGDTSSGASIQGSDGKVPGGTSRAIRVASGWSGESEIGSRRSLRVRAIPGVRSAAARTAGATNEGPPPGSEEGRTYR